MRQEDVIHKLASDTNKIVRAAAKDNLAKKKGKRIGTNTLVKNLGLKLVRENTDSLEVNW